MDYTFYIITCKDENIPECYVGSTNDLDNRKRQHKQTCNGENYKDHNAYVYQFMRENGGFDNWVFGVLGIHSFDDKKDALVREQYYIDCYDAKLNSQKAINMDSKSLRSKKYNEKNKEKISLYHRIYREENKEKILLRHKKYYEENKENVLLRCKNYRENNEEKNLLRHKKYREENKEKIALRRKEYRLRKKQLLP